MYPCPSMNAFKAIFSIEIFSQQKWKSMHTCTHRNGNKILIHCKCVPCSKGCIISPLPWIWNNINSLRVSWNVFSSYSLPEFSHITSNSVPSQLCALLKTFEIHQDHFIFLKYSWMCHLLWSMANLAGSTLLEKSVFPSGNNRQ